MIHAFRDPSDAAAGPDQDRDVFLCGDPGLPCLCFAETAAECTGGVRIGRIESGRKMASVVNGRDKLWTEWMFTPDAPDQPPAPVRESYIRAREDARVYAKALRVGAW